MDDTLKIYIDRLRDDQVEQFDFLLSPEFIGISDRDLSFELPIAVTGKAYLAEEELVFQLSLKTVALCRCIICNGKVPVGVDIRDAYQTEDLDNIKGAVFDMSDMLREMILLEIPAYVECHEGQCPDRELMKKYMKSQESIHENKQRDDDGYHPFSQLSLDDTCKENLQKKKKVSDYGSTT